MTERITISFQQKAISDVTCQFLCSKLDTTEDEDIIRNIQMLTSWALKKLRADDANILVRKLLQAIIINDNLDESILTATSPETEIETETENDDEFETGDKADSEENDTDITIQGVPPKIVTSTPGGPKFNNPKVKKVLSKSKSQMIQNKTSGNVICRYYNTGRCNKADQCKFKHPKICHKFKKYGHINTNTKGCHDNCEYLLQNKIRKIYFQVKFLYHVCLCNLGLSLNIKNCNFIS